MYSGSGGDASMRVLALEAALAMESGLVSSKLTDAFLLPSPTVRVTERLPTSWFWVIEFFPNRTEATLLNEAKAEE